MREAALAAWLAQRDADDGCALMATTLVRREGQFTPADAWRKARLAIDASRPRAARQAAVLLVDPTPQVASATLLDSPARYLARKARPRQPRRRPS